MTAKDKTTDASKVELTDEELDGVEGAAADFFLKLEGVKGESRIPPGETVSLNFGKIENRYSKAPAAKIGSKTLKF